jgi:hypothetical protein
MAHDIAIVLLALASQGCVVLAVVIGVRSGVF